MNHYSYYLNDIIVRTANAALGIQRQDGSFPAGHNGPHFDVDTPCRNTSHWIITLVKAYEISNEIKFKKAAIKAADVLCSMRLENGTFWHRKNVNKDLSNGLIGQAWTIEALLTLNRVLGYEKYFKVAREVFLIYPFNFEIGLWHDISNNGRILPVKPTINQQIWFAAAGAFIAQKDKSINKYIERFLEKFSFNARLKKDGLLGLRIKQATIFKQFFSRLWDLLLSLSEIKGKIVVELKRKAKNELPKIEAGYHPFALYGLAILKENKPNHDFWHSDTLRIILDYITTDEFYSNIEDNIYSFEYNPIGFEIAYTITVFKDSFKNSRVLIKEWLSDQIRRCFNFSSGLMENNSIDKPTLSARIYECTRLPNLKIDLDI